MKGGSDQLDVFLKEMLSFQLYKGGKEPLEGIDPKERIRRSIWRDDGIDLDLLQKQGPTMPGFIISSKFFTFSQAIVKEGLLRRKKTHRLMTNIASMDLLDGIFEAARREEMIKMTRSLCRSEILYPTTLTRPIKEIRSRLSELGLERSVQTEMMDISPRSAVRYLLQDQRSTSGDEDLSRIFEKTVPERSFIRTRSGSVISDLKSLVAVVLGSSDEDVRAMIESGSLIELARDGLRSPRLEGVLSDLSKDADGTQESPQRFRLRLGRVMTESEISSELFQKITVPMLERFRTCSSREASRLRSHLGPLMDLRSSPLLKELVFDVPSSNRVQIITLMGDSGDRNLLETLERIRDFSTVDSDRSAAADAIRSLGGL